MLYNQLLISILNEGDLIDEIECIVEIFYKQYKVDQIIIKYSVNYPGCLIIKR
jgi:hypothetical protein